MNLVVLVIPCAVEESRILHAAAGLGAEPFSSSEAGESWQNRMEASLFIAVSGKNLLW